MWMTRSDFNDYTLEDLEVVFNRVLNPKCKIGSSEFNYINEAMNQDILASNYSDQFYDLYTEDEWNYVMKKLKKYNA